MKSTPTPWTQTGVTSEEITTEFGAGRIKHAVTVPEGTLCVKLEGGTSRWVVQDLAFLGDINSIAYHDADHYGIDIPQNKITGILPAGVPRTEKAKPQLQVVGGEAAFDVWKDNYGRITALRATKTFVDDSDAPYGYSKHEIRVTAANGRAALAAYRAALLTPAKADANYYGTAICPADAESRLRRAGAEVSEYDHKAGCFYLRAPHDSVDLILDLQDDFKIDLRARNAADEVWLRDIATLPVEALPTERAFHQFWVHSDKNDGRLSPGSSAELDIRFDQIDAIDKRLKEMAELSPVKNASQPQPGNAPPSPSPDM